MGTLPLFNNTLYTYFDKIASGFTEYPFPPGSGPFSQFPKKIYKKLALST
jgi:hypothetical protein